MQKDLCQLDDLAALVCPPLSPAVKWLRYGTAVTLTIGAKSAQVFGLWRPSNVVAPIETEQVASEENDVELDTRGNKKQKKEDEKVANRRESLGLERDSVPSGANGRRKRKQGGSRDRNPGPYAPYSTGSIKNID
ncbi:hypothetical protein K443DRAFT_600247 [Laccaria amethystina LaAM-08-1]|uniref:Uncharacterized protein n=1 Tax=Laccaria amethystina LaAM-08-1 TaxID=1095629 RepID=A0A0C9WQK5_9AGAR|nr:hypothetical protein K443DRAFT_600247 [Laccaria amethystina LaAM-08-1]